MYTFPKDSIYFDYILYDVDNIKMPKSKLKGIKLIRSETTSNDATSNEPCQNARPAPNAQACSRSHSSSTDSNRNEEDANNENNNMLENVQDVNEAVNVNAGTLQS